MTPFLQQAVVMVIGDEILSGRRRDGHVAHVVDRLTSLGVAVVWAWILGDDRGRIARALGQCRQDGETLFCFGGIGATPDDHTRQAAALAWDLPLVRHPQALAAIEARFGGEAYPHRVLMAELPQGCALIPNPRNVFPGFTVGRQHFFPGFPDMAWPMLEWVLESLYSLPGKPTPEMAILVPGAKEGMVAALLAELEGLFPGVRSFSLPKLGEDPSLELGVKGGDVKEVEAALGWLVGRLQGMGFVLPS